MFLGEIIKGIDLAVRGLNCKLIRSLINAVLGDL